jgi:hypothetical protein
MAVEYVDEYLRKELSPRIIFTIYSLKMNSAPFLSIKGMRVSIFNGIGTQ